MHNVSIYFNELDYTLDRFMKFNLRQDILNPPFEFTATFWLKDFEQSHILSMNNQPVTISIDGNAVLFGLIHSRKLEGNGVCTISGTDTTSEIDVDLEPTLKCNDGDKLISTIQRFLDPYGFAAVTGYDTARNTFTQTSNFNIIPDPSTITIAKTKINTGSQCLQVINDLAAKYGYIVAPTAKPFEVAVIRPQFSQNLVYNINNTLPINDDNNVIADTSELDEDYRRVPTLIQAFGTNAQPDKTKVGTFENLKLKETVNTDPIIKNAFGKRAVTARWKKGDVYKRDMNNFTLYRPIFEQDQKHTRQQNELFHLANRRFIEKFKDVYSYSTQLKGFKNINGAYYSPDTLCLVNDHGVGILGETLWISECTFTYSSNQFTTSIKALRPSTYNLGSIVANSLSI